MKANPRMSRNLFISAGLLAFVIAAALPAAAQHLYKIDSTHSSAQFSVTHMMISKVNGEFQKVSGTVYMDPEKPENDKIEATIDTTTISTRDEKRDGHLKSPDFFDVAKFPELTFKSTGASMENGKLMVHGDLTLHGVTKPVTLAVEGPSAEIKDPQGNLRVGASATTKINRKDFGLMWSKTIDGGGMVVGDDVNINIDVELVRKP
jgi:polyisoprenoid-binding protein YceI